MKLFTKPSIYFIMGTQNTGNRDPLLVLEDALKGGISHFQLREKGTHALTGEALKRFALECQARCRAYSVPFIVNDDVQLACEIGADGAHVGQDDLDGAAARAQIGAGKLLGVSVHSTEEAERAVAAGADYVGMGPVYGTRTKSDAKPPAGVSGILAVKKAFPLLPVVGIGGIKPENAGPVWEAGADSVAVISALTAADDTEAEVRRFLAAYEGGVLK